MYSHRLGTANRLLVSALPSLAVAAWGITTAIGLLRLRPWARVSILVISLMAAQFCFTAALQTALLPTPNVASNASMFDIRVGLTLLYFGCGGIAGLWVGQFSEKGMDQLFQLAIASPWRPLSFSVIAIWFIIVWPLTLYSIILHLTRGLIFPALPLGMSIPGSAANAYHVGLTVGGVAIGLGLLRMKQWAQLGAITLCVFTIISKVAAALRPDTVAQVVGVVNAEMNTWTPYLFIWAETLLAMLLPGAALWFLITSRQGLNS